MPTIYDNIDIKFSDGLTQHIESADRVDYCVGYFNIRGWKTVCNKIKDLNGMDVYENGKLKKRYCRLLVGMTKTPQEAMMEELNPELAIVDNEKASKIKRELAEEFKKQLELGVPSDDDEKTIRLLLRQLKEGKVVVKLFLEYQLHAKLYLAYSKNGITNNIALLGSSNFTFSGLRNQGELNVDVLDQDAAVKLSRWFDKRWNSRWCVDITKELIEVIENSWASEYPVPPYYIYMKMAYHLSQEARSGISEFKLPKEFKKELLDFQQKAVLIACQHLNKRNGVMIGDVVGLGKTITACAIAKIMEEDLMMNTLILCPKNLVIMWQGYIEKYGLHAHVLSHSMIMSELPSLKRYRLVIIDESHNFRNSENKTYKVVRTYIEENDSKVMLLSATPYNKSYKDLANQLKLFIPEDYDIGIAPERYMESLGGPVQFHMKHDNVPAHSINAFEKSTDADDWRELMRLYLVRRTRSFIKNNYALEDNKRKYLEFSDGTRSYFPDRIPKKVLFPMSQQDSKDQYAKLYDAEVVDLIDELALARYTLRDYIDEKCLKKASKAEKGIVENLSRAGHRTKGFCRTNLFKRLESSGYAFLLSVERIIIRNSIVEYAILNNLPVPVGGNSVSIDMQDEIAEYSDSEGDADIIKTPKHREHSDYASHAKDLYTTIIKEKKNRFQWISANLFDRDKLVKDLAEDNEKLIFIINKVGTWNPAGDRKLEALYNLLMNIHDSEKVIIFTQYSDTANYLKNELEYRGVAKLGVATGDSDNVTGLVKCFSPSSNDYTVSDDEIRILISTDVLSEGQNLQDSHIVVNFDLPWALIRLVQRAGRVDRLGQKSEQIFCYSFLPEDGIEQIIGLRQKLKTRIQQNAEVVGSDEVFFDGDPINIADLYSEKSGILDEEDDSEVDLASYAFQIWNNAIHEHPDLKNIIPGMANAVYSTKQDNCQATDSLILYSRTNLGNDVFSWIDENFNVITQSQYKILKAAECDYDCPVQEKISNHNKLLQVAMEGINTDEYSGMGTLGRRTGVRYKSYLKISRFIEEFEGNEDLNKYKRVLDDIYKYPLCERARDILGRLLKINTGDEEFAETALMLREDDRLVIGEDSEFEFKPNQILCSLGIRKDK